MKTPFKKQARAVISVSGMNCTSCAKHIEEALQQTQGVSSARVDFAVEKAYIDYDPAVLNNETLLQAIKNTGYQGTLSEE